MSLPRKYIKYQIPTIGGKIRSYNLANKSHAKGHHMQQYRRVQGKGSREGIENDNGSLRCEIPFGQL